MILVDGILISTRLDFREVCEKFHLKKTRALSFDKQNRDFILAASLFHVVDSFITLDFLGSYNG